MSKKYIHILSLALLLILGTVIFTFVIWPKIFGLPFSGETEHDFGIVQVEPPHTIVEHIFQLKNETGRVIKLVNAVPTCGCTTTDWPTEEVGVGKELLVPVHLKLQRSEIKRSKIRLEFDSGDAMVLKIVGSGRQLQPLSCKPHVLELVDGDTDGTRGILKLERYVSSPPPMPRVVTPEGVQVEFTSWRKAKAGDEQQGKPDEWTMQIAVFLAGLLAEDSKVEVKIEEAPSLFLDLKAVESKAKPRF